jgi:hypothetical protein
MAATFVGSPWTAGRTLPCYAEASMASEHLDKAVGKDGKLLSGAANTSRANAAADPSQPR